MSARVPVLHHPLPSPPRPLAWRGGCAWLCSGFILGAALQLRQSALWPAWPYAGLALISLAGLLVLLRARRGAPALAALMLLMAAMAGFGSTGWRAAGLQATALAPALEGRDIEVTGEVAAMPQMAEEGVRFRLQVESARLADADSGQGAAAVPVVLPPLIALGWYAPMARAGARPAAIDWVERSGPDSLDSEVGDLAQQRQPQALHAGERWRMTVRLKAPHGNVNPHGFDYELWLWEQGLQATGYVRAGSADTPPRRLSAGWGHPVEWARQSVREAIYRRVDDRRLAGVLAALVVGDQAAIERADWEVFRTTGVAHLMSISGLHITMFAWLASRLLGTLWRRTARFTPRLCLRCPASAAGAWGGLLLAVLYALFSGWGVPAQRTACMLAVVVFLRQGGRQWPWRPAWLLAMAAVVALDPWALLQAGFWLSFVAVGVLFATDGGAGRAPASDLDLSSARSLAARTAAALWRGLREQWIVTLALTPLSLLLFNQVSLVGLLANAVAIPWVTLVVTPLAMAGVAWAPLWDVAAGAAGLLTWGLQGLASWPAASLSVAAAPPLCAMAGVVGGALLAMRLSWQWKVLGLPLLLPVLLWQAPPVPTGQFELLAADIGQGNAVLVRTAGHALLYDTGPAFSRDSDAGQRVLVPLLRALGVRLDRLLLSHRDSDHIGGAPAVLAMQPQADLLSSIEDGHPLQSLRRATRCVAGQHWTWDGVEFNILQPPAEAYATMHKPNTVSCVLRISNGVQTALLVGDIEAPQELALVANEAGKEGEASRGSEGGPGDAHILGSAGALRADFLLVPHHGSKTSSTDAFIDAMRPRWAVAQAGYRNRFGHPANMVVARYESHGVHVLDSPACGAATWRSARPQQLTSEREAARRYWHALH